MKSKNLSEKILRTVKSKGFNYIELDSVGMKQIISLKDLVKLLEDLFFLSKIKKEMNFV